MQQIKRIPVFARLMLMGAIPLAMLGVIVGVLSYLHSRDIVKETQKTAITDTINRIDINLNVKTRQLCTLTEILGHSAQVEALLTHDEKGEELDLFSQDIVQGAKEITDVYIFEGKTLIYKAQSNAQSIPATVLSTLYDNMDEKLSEKRVRATASLYTDGQKDFVYVYVGLYDEARTLRGLLVLEVKPDLLISQILTRQTVLKGQSFFITDGEDTILSQNGSPETTFLETVLKQYHEGVRRFYVDHNISHYYVASQDNALTGWTTFTTIRDENMFPEAKSLRTYIAAVVVVAVIVFIIGLIFLANTLVQPLNRLTKAMGEVENENYDIRLENDRGDEIGVMMDGFNSMVNKIQYLIDEVYRNQLDVKTAQNKALQAQINPHFLYNAMDSLNWMLIDRGEMEISSMIVSLGQILQYAMDTTTTEVTIQEECDNIERYLQVQKMRLEDRISVRVNVHEDVNTFLVPKLTIQPFVENAIKYGVESSVRKVTVTVEAYRQDEYLYIIIDDDGRGMDEKAVEFYRSLLTQYNANVGRIGVQNAARRLQFYFKDQCVFSAHSHPQRGLRVEIRIPIDGERQL